MIFCRNFLSHSTKNIIGVNFSVSEILSYRKNFWINRMGGISRFSVGNVLSHSAKKIVQEPFSVSLILVSINFMH